MFFYQQWLHQRLNEYVNSSKPPKLHGREVIMPPNQYGAALMQAYLGKISLSLDCRAYGNLTFTLASAAQCHFISAEVSMFENLLRVAIRATLYRHFAKLGKRLISRYKNNLTLSA
jgi:hypothetical protein